MFETSILARSGRLRSLLSSKTVCLITGGSLLFLPLAIKYVANRASRLPGSKWLYGAAIFSMMPLFKAIRKSKKSKHSKSGSKRKANNEDTSTGFKRGIEGSRNSCYLDAFLFSIFYATNSFDCILSENSNDSKLARKTRVVLRESIVQPLRQNRFCSAEQTMVLRKLLKDYNPKIMGSFQAIEDVVYLLFEKALNEPKFIKYEDDIFGYMHVMLADTSSTSLVAQTQECFKESMTLYGNMKLKAVPSPAFILSLPWHKNRLFHYTAIVPTLTLEFGDKINDVKCDHCENLSEWESVVEQTAKGSNVETKYNCDACIKTFATETTYVNRLKMSLTAVMCFRGVHFTAFVRDCMANVEDDKWLYFDSMAGSSSEVKDVTSNLLTWYSRWEEAVTTGNMLPYDVRSFFMDVHTCVYEPIVFCKTKPSQGSFEKTNLPG